ncbi:lipase/Acylhydrolase with GDSL-like motif in BtlB locus [Halalkalibacter wakoensis JCM 9140]|uniref:Lipase/Acylhydrolase with GDSL-like motif in BtlB locus n=1 Tax=Halalkalibacter wakoensis JCM 9140 TaxID=1236970 RepID=W4Q1B9_9BACI|nr:GDSL-type esterase/lipase family protein [Halalkalibacter wakoensis]GAE25498.1 lipase/Acylhydrolase with GDSL-like motif in BtlB locus [Halalkalibacter wakoensis JCM 9140]
MHFTYTALGDSLTVGVGALLSSGFVKRYAKMIETTYQIPVSLRIKAKPGMNSSQLLQTLSSSHIKKAIAQADLITITIGGNDLLQAYRNKNQPHALEQSVHLFVYNLSQILQKIALIKSFSPRPYKVQLIGLYNPIPFHPYSAYFVQKFNHVLRRFSSGPVSYVDVYDPFQSNGTKLLAGDFHPNNRGYQIIANRAFWDFMQPKK